MSIGHLLIHLCSVKRLTQTSQGHGRFSESYEPHLSRRRCRVSTNIAMSKERVEGQQQKTYTEMTIYFDPGTDVARNDQVTDVIREDGTTDSNHYRVTSVVQPSKRHHLKATAELIQLGE